MLSIFLFFRMFVFNTEINPPKATVKNIEITPLNRYTLIIFNLQTVFVVYNDQTFIAWYTSKNDAIDNEDFFHWIIFRYEAAFKCYGWDRFITVENWKIRLIPVLMSKRFH